MNYWHILLLFAAFYLVHFFLSIQQMRNFSHVFVELRKRGPVAIGKHQSLFSWGAIVMFVLGPDGVVKEGVCLTGVTVFSRFKKVSAFDGASMAELERISSEQRRMPSAVRKAVSNAAHNYREFISGKTPQEPLGPITRMYARLSRTKIEKEVQQ